MTQSSLLWIYYQWLSVFSSRNQINIHQPGKIE